MSLMEGRCRMSGGSHACHGHGMSRSRRGGMAEAPASMAKEIASDRASKRTKSLEMIGHDRTSLGPIQKLHKELEPWPNSDINISLKAINEGLQK